MGDGDLLDPSLTEVGVDQIIAARASLLGEDGVLSEIGAKEGSVPVLASPLSRTMETALIATNGASKLEPPIVVTDYLRERLELNTPFEIRRPVSVDDDTTPASKAIAHTHVPHCKFKKGLNQLYGDELFDIGVKSNEKRHKDCRVDRVGPLSYGHCESLTLTHESDFDLGDVEEETMLGMMSRVKVVLANIFDTYDENVVVLVTHSDWIIAALMELYPDTLGFVPRNGEIVPVLVEDRRESSQKVSKGAKPTKKHSDDYEDEEEATRTRTRRNRTGRLGRTHRSQSPTMIIPRPKNHPGENRNRSQTMTIRRPKNHPGENRSRSQMMTIPRPKNHPGENRSRSQTMTLRRPKSHPGENRSRSQTMTLRRPKNHPGENRSRSQTMTIPRPKNHPGENRSRSQTMTLRRPKNHQRASKSLKFYVQ